jgi:hypothetical protein
MEVYILGHPHQKCIIYSFLKGVHPIFRVQQLGSQIYPKFNMHKIN